MAAHAAAVERIDDAWRNGVLSLLDAESSAAEKDLADAKVAGNTSRQARAIAMRQVCQKVAESFAETAKPVFPENVRREIRPAVADLQSRVEAVCAERETHRAEADAVLRTAVRAALEASGAASDDEAVEDAIRRASAPSPASAPAASGASTATGAGEGAGDAAPEAPSAPYDSSGEATAWAPLLGVAVTVPDVDIVSIPVVGIRERRTLTFHGGYGDIPAAISPMQNVLSRPAANAAVAFRVLNVPGFPAPDVMEWPSERNGWNLRLRCRPGEDVSRPVALKLEVDARVPGLSSLRGGDGSPAGAAESDHVSVPVESRPSGAVILVDGRALRGPDGKPLRTPCEVLLPRQGAALELRLAGYLPRTIPRAVPPADGRPVVIALSRDPNHIDKKLQVKAASAGAMTGLQLQQGRRYRVHVEGTWSCDAAKTAVGPGGYTLDAHPQFYADPGKFPRLTDEAGYGALLYAVGKGGWKPLPADAVLTPEAGGPLRFEINEGGAPRSRMDNAGALSVHILSLP